MRHKNRLLQHLISDASVTKAIIFSATKRDADQLASELFAQGHAAAALHGDMSQGARNKTIMNMRRGKVRLLVATDVAARGLDVTGVSHVINFDLPKFAEDYVHRIGRTGRAGASGIAISFCSGNEVAYLDRIERYTGTKLQQFVIPGLEPTRPLRRASGGAPGARKGRPSSFDSRKKPFASKGRPAPAGKPGRRDPQVVVEYRRGRNGAAK
jgi:superfamily II DNA/RNA helicase